MANLSNGSDGAVDKSTENIMDWSGGLPVKAGDMFLGLYQPSPETAEFWNGVKRKELLIKECACGELHHPRRIACPECGSTQLKWIEASGRGTIYTFSEVFRAPGVFSASVPFSVGIVQLEEGVHLFGRILTADGGAPHIEQKVVTRFRELEQGYLYPVFEGVVS